MKTPLLFIVGMIGGCLLGRTGSLAAEDAYARDFRATHLIALTFDVGGSSIAVRALADGLSGRQIYATFFMPGAWAETHPEVVVELDRAGHEVAVAAWDPPAFTTWSNEEMMDQITRTRDLLAKLLGHPPVPLVRVPSDVENSRIRRNLRSVGMRSVSWGFDSMDLTPGRATPQHIYDRLVLASDEQLDGVVVLLHAGRPATAEAMPLVVDALRERGFHFVRASEWVRLAPRKDHLRSKSTPLPPRESHDREKTLVDRGDGDLGAGVERLGQLHAGDLDARGLAFSAFWPRLAGDPVAPGLGDMRGDSPCGQLGAGRQARRGSRTR